MATSKLVVRKNGIPVKRFWRERISQKSRDERYQTTYPIYFTASHAPKAEDNHTVWSLTDEKAPRTLEEACQKAEIMVNSPDTVQTHATVYELRAVYRYGVEWDWKRYSEEKQAYHKTPHVRNDQCDTECVNVLQGPTFRRISTTSQP